MNRAPHRGFFLYNRNYAIIFIPFICSKIHLAEWIAIKSKQKLKITVNLVALALFVGMIIYLSLRFTPQVLSLYKRRHEFERAVKDQGLTGIAAFILLQVLQIVVAAIPGEVVQLLGGYLYGTVLGTVYLVIGVVIGSSLAFFAARLLGFRLVKLLMPPARLEKIYGLVNGPKAEFIMLVLFLIPGVPKDFLTYIAGLTPVKPEKFLLIAIIGRLPALVVSCYIGASLRANNFRLAIACSIAVLFFFLGSWFYKDRILEGIRR